MFPNCLPVETEFLFAHIIYETIDPKWYEKFEFELIQKANVIPDLSQQLGYFYFLYLFLVIHSIIPMMICFRIRCQSMCL